MRPRQDDPQPPVEPEIPEHTVRVAYQPVLHGGRENVLRVKSELVLPPALDMENLAQTDVHFPELMYRVTVQPVVTKFRSFLQKQFYLASRAALE